MAPAAIGESAGRAVLHMGSRWDFGQASLVGDKEQKGVEVEVRPLSELVRDSFGRVDAVKIDIEGFEDRALGGFLSACSDQELPASLVIEHLHRRNWIIDLEALVIARGYELVRRTSNNLLFAR